MITAFSNSIDRNELRTPRLIIRPFQETDAADAHTWFGDADVMHHIPGGPNSSIEQTRQRIHTYISHQREYGYSKWIVTDRFSGEAIGDCGLLHLPESRDVELGFRFKRSRWGKGLATEAGHAWIDFAFGPLQLNQVLAIVLPDHDTSLRVLAKLGFSPAGRGTYYDMDFAVYKICATLK